MELKQRIIGIVVLLALGVMTVPLLFDSEVVLPVPKHITAVATQNAPQANNSSMVFHQDQISDVSNKTIAHQQEDRDYAKRDNSNSQTAMNQASPENETFQYSQTETASTNDSSQVREVSHQTETSKTVRLNEVSQEKESASVRTVNEAALERESAEIARLNKLSIQKENVKIAQENISSQTSGAGKTGHVNTFSLSDGRVKATDPGETSARKGVTKDTLNLVHHGRQEFKLTSASTDSTPWVVQLGLFSEPGNAKKLIARLESKGFKGFVQQDKSNKKLHRVLIGPQTDRNAADQIVSQLQKQLSIKAIVVRYRG